MKKSISQFKKFSYASLQFLKQQHMPFVMTILTIVAVGGCRLFQSSSDEASLSPQQDTVAALGLKDTDERGNPLLSSTNNDLDVVLIKIKDAKQNLLGEIAAPTCLSDKPVQQSLNLRLFFNSPFGAHLAIATIGDQTTPDKIAISIESRRLAFTIDPASAALLEKSACLALEKNEKAPEILADATTTAMMQDWLSHVAPDCTFDDISTHGFDCKLPQADVNAAKQEIAGIRSSMIRTWSRQPYLLSRRLAVADLLAQALLSDEREKKLGTVCKLVMNSLASELPATLASRRWQDGACRRDLSMEQREKAARFGLVKSVDEIDFLRQLFERTSRLGSLTLKLPHNQMPNASLWITLVPDVGVTDNLTNETAKMWLTETPHGKTDAVVAEGQPKACWHPVFAEETGLLQLARHLVLAGEADGVTCMEDVTTTPTANAANSIAAKNTFSLERYLAESIASETEFVLQNGKSQTLRLPIGHYTYRIHGLPENPEEWDDAASNGPQSTGTIVWDTNRPRAVISQW